MGRSLVEVIAEEEFEDETMMAEGEGDNDIAGEAEGLAEEEGEEEEEECCSCWLRRITCCRSVSISC